jgi:hypothetical protein
MRSRILRRVAALLDIWGKGSAAQRGSHLFGDGVVEVLEDFEFDRITYAHDECTSSRGGGGLY